MALRDVEIAGDETVIGREPLVSIHATER